MRQLIDATSRWRQTEFALQPIGTSEDDGAKRQVRTGRGITDAEFDVELPRRIGGISRGKNRTDAQRGATILLHDVDHRRRPAVRRQA